MTNQAERVNKVIKFIRDKLLAQGKKSMEYDQASGVEKCTYKSKDGCRCAVGHIFSDEILLELEEAGSLTLSFWRIERTPHLKAKLVEHLKKSFELADNDIAVLIPNLHHTQSLHDQYPPLHWGTLFNEMIVRINEDYSKIS